MDNSRLPRMIFYGQLQQGERSCGGQRRRYKNVLHLLHHDETGMISVYSQLATDGWPDSL